MHERSDRTERMTITLSKREKDAIQNIARGCKMTMSKFVRRVIMETVFKGTDLEG